MIKPSRVELMSGIVPIDVSYKTSYSVSFQLPDGEVVAGSGATNRMACADLMAKLMARTGRHWKAVFGDGFVQLSELSQRRDPNPADVSQVTHGISLGNASP